MTKKFLAKGFEQVFLGLKMGIEGSTTHIGPFNDLSNGDVLHVFFRKQIGECSENGFPGFFLPSVHTFSPICSVSIMSLVLYIEFLTHWEYAVIEQYVL